MDSIRSAAAAGANESVLTRSGWTRSSLLAHSPPWRSRSRHHGTRCAQSQKPRLPAFLRTANDGGMKAKGLLWTLLVLLLGGGGCRPSAQQTEAVLSAVKVGDLEKVKALLKDQPALVFSKDTNGMTALHLAANYGHKDVAELLLANRAKVNAKNNNGATPLHSAAGAGDKDTAELLLANKAEVDAKTTDGRTPLHIAALAGRTKMAELLLASKAEVNARDNDGRTPLHWVAGFTDHKDVTELLLASKAEVNAKDNGGWTPLHWAAANGNKNVLESLLANKAEVNAKADLNGMADAGETPLHNAVRMKRQEVAELLRQHGGHE